MTQISLSLRSIQKLELKPISKVVILAESLDLLTTFVGLLLFPQIWEANPMLSFLGGWLPTVLAKIVATLVIVIVIEHRGKWSRLIWLVPCIAAFPVIWNIINMLAEIAARA